MVYTRVLTLNQLSAGTYYGYLLAYNVVYVVPLALIVIAFTVTLGRRTLQEHEGRVLKLLAGMMMLLLGAVMLLAPPLLHHLLASIGILLIALAATALIELVSRLCRRHSCDPSSLHTHMDNSPSGS